MRALPPGASAVATNLVAAGATTYGFLALTARVLGPEGHAPLAVLWSAVFFVVPAVWGPLEAEIGRRVAGRAELDLGARPVTRAGVGIALVFGGVIAVVVVASSWWLGDALFSGHPGVAIALALAVIGFAANHLMRAAMAGVGAFGAYGACVSLDSASRLVLAGVLAVAGVREVVPYALVVAVAPVVPVAVLRRRGAAIADGPAERPVDVARSVGPLVGGQVFAQALVNGGPIVVAALATASEQTRASQFLVALVVARVPLFFFQAVQGSLLPALARHEAAGDVAGFRDQLRRLIVLVTGIGLAGTLGAWAVGPAAVRFAFGAEFALGHRDLALLAAGAGAFMIATVAAHGLVALTGHDRVAAGWAVGVLSAAVIVATGDDLLWRVEAGFAGGCAVAAVALGTGLSRSFRRWSRRPELSEI